ncbi:MAG: hypothetical protein ACRDSE_15465 [Pseudonocardiaceae bacterium]
MSITLDSDSALTSHRDGPLLPPVVGRELLQSRLEFRLRRTTCHGIHFTTERAIGGLQNVIADLKESREGPARSGGDLVVGVLG